MAKLAVFLFYALSAVGVYAGIAYVVKRAFRRAVDQEVERRLREMVRLRVEDRERDALLERMSTDELLDELARRPPSELAQEK